MPLLNPYDQISQLKQTVRAAQETIIEYIIPNGVTAEETISKLIGLLDNPEVVELMSKTNYQVDPI